MSHNRWVTKKKKNPRRCPDGEFDGGLLVIQPKRNGVFIQKRGNKQKKQFAPQAKAEPSPDARDFKKAKSKPGRRPQIRKHKGEGAFT